MTLGHELRALDAMINFKSWLIKMTKGCELKDLDAMNNLELSMT